MNTLSNMEIFGKKWPVITLLLWFIRITGCRFQGYCDGAVPESETSFNITCLQTLTDSTTDSIKQRTSYSSGEISSVTESVVEPDGNKKPKTDIIIPIVATTISVVCLAGVVALVVVCRRRSFADKPKSKTSTSVVKKEKEDEYYMTENPMYNATDVEQNMPSADSDYHYIEAENEVVSMPDNQYEYIPDSLVTGQFPDKTNDLHYDYTTCASSKGKIEPMLNKNINQNNIENTKVREQESKLTTCDTMYDRTDTAGAKTFMSVNDYHHISPAASRKRVAMNTYNTSGEVKST